MFVRPLNRVRSVLFFFCWFLRCFLSKNNAFLFQLVLEPCGRMAEKNWVGPKTAVFRPFPRGKKVSMPSRHKPSLKLPYRILPPSPTSIVLWCLWARFGVVITNSHNNSRKNSHKNSHKYSRKYAKMGIFWLGFSVQDHLRFYFLFFSELCMRIVILTHPTTG